MPTEIERGRLFAVLSYLSILSLIAVAFGRENEYAAFHIKQGLLLFVMEVVAVPLGIIPNFGIYILAIIWLALIVLSFIGAFSAWNGKSWRLPSPIDKWANEIQL